jgi:group II intron reverse transcriptase/maturase
VSGPKSFEISKHVVFEAYRRVKDNKGAAGVDGESIEQFEVDLKDNLYKLWNRLSSGCYFPPPVRMVEIDKPGGRGVRILGVPTVADRIAQTVAAMYLEPDVEKIFHPDSYGYRPRRSALDAVGRCRERCWRTDWVIDMDIKGFFDNLDHDLVLKAVAHHTDQRWILLYVQRWLTAPLQRQDGSLVARDRGSPQGSAISPLLANLFMHYAFDTWMARVFPAVGFERYCDDVVVHCRSEAEAHQVRAAIAARLDECGGLQLHPEKTRIVYCKDGARRGSYEHTSFTFLVVRVSCPQGSDEDGEDILQLQPCHQRRSRQTRPGADPLLAAAPTQWIDPGGPRTRHQHGRARVDQLLRAVLQVRPGTQPQPHQRLPGAVDRAEIQTVSGTMDASARRAGQGRKALPEALRPLAVRQTVTGTTG